MAGVKLPMEGALNQELLELGARVDDHAANLNLGKVGADVRVERLQADAERRGGLRAAERQRRHRDVDARTTHGAVASPFAIRASTSPWHGSSSGQ